MQNINQKKGKIRTKKILRWIGTIITLLMFVYLIQAQDWSTIWITISKFSLNIMLIVWILFASRILVNSVRWFILLNIANIGIPFIECLKLFLLGLFVSNFLPSTIGGDGIRYLALLRFEDDKAKALSSIIIDRLVNVFAMILLLPISLIVFFNNIIQILDMSMIGVVTISGLKNKFYDWLDISKTWIKKNEFWFKSPDKIFASLMVSWIAQVSYFYGIWLIARYLGMDIGYFQIIGITVLTYLITLLPISVNGYGVREISITSLYSLLGYPIEAAISLAIVSRLIYLSTTLIGAVWLPEYLSYLDKKVPELR